MDRNQPTLIAVRMAVVLSLFALSTAGCGKSMMYHFKHYQRPLAAIAKSNQTYFHSSQSGKIIEKDPCAQYCEPDCFGYEPTCWSQWPQECAGNCPTVPSTPAVQAMPYDGQIILDHEVVVPQTSIAPSGLSDPGNAPSESVVPSLPEMPADATLPAGETRLPSLGMPSIPADVESSVPSPSDSTRFVPSYLPRVTKLPPTKLERSAREPLLAAGQSASLPILLAPTSDQKSTDQVHVVKVSPVIVPQLDREAHESERIAPKPVGIRQKLQAVKRTTPKPTRVEGMAKSSRKARSLSDKLRVRAPERVSDQSVEESVGMKTDTAMLPAVEYGRELVADAAKRGQTYVEMLKSEKPTVARSVVQPPVAAKADHSTLKLGRQAKVSIDKPQLIVRLKETMPAKSRLAINGSEALPPKATRPATEKPTLVNTESIKVPVAKVPVAKVTKAMSPEKLVIKAELKPDAKSENVVAKSSRRIGNSTTLKVSDTGTTVIRFASDSKSKKSPSRITADQESTVIRFAPSTTKK